VHRLAYSFDRDGSEVVRPGSKVVETDLVEPPEPNAAASDPHRPIQCRAMRQRCVRPGSSPQPAGRGCSRADQQGASAWLQSYAAACRRRHAVPRRRAAGSRAGNARDLTCLSVTVLIRPGARLVADKDLKAPFLHRLVDIYFAESANLCWLSSSLRCETLTSGKGTAG
jgi:hypothetical protein